MSVVAPPRVEPPREDEPELLIPEARARQRKRQLGAAVLVAVLAGATLGIYAFVSASGRIASTAPSGSIAGARSGNACGMHIVGTRILASNGDVLYRDPAKGAMASDLKCSGSTVWAMFLNGIGTNVEQGIAVRSGDRGRTWRVAFGTGTKFGFSYGPWALSGPRAAYFAGTCVPCSVGSTYGVVSLAVTKDGGRTFHFYRVPGLTGYPATSLRVSGDEVTIEGRRVARKINVAPYELYRYKVATVQAS